MSSQNYTCPSCSAPLEVAHRFTKLVICAYCNQASLVTPSGLDPSGEQVPLADFPSRFAIGKSGTLNGETFTVLGRLRYGYEGGFWDEWFLSFSDGKKRWLQEDEGELTLFEKESLTAPVPAFNEISVGSLLPVNEFKVFVTEKNKASIRGGEGELFFTVQPGSTVYCIDGNAGGELVSLEFSDSEICFSKGKEISHESINLEDQ